MEMRSCFSRGCPLLATRCALLLGCCVSTRGLRQHSWRQESWRVILLSHISPVEAQAFDGGTSCAYELLHLMDFFRHRSFQIFCALFAFFVFTGDIVADAVYEASGACATECESSGCDTCPACVCPTHTGSAAASDGDAIFAHDLSTNDSVAITDIEPAFAAPQAIDHPPQLA